MNTSSHPMVNEPPSPPSSGSRTDGIVLSVLGIVLMFAFVIPYLGTVVGIIGLILLFVGLGMFGFASRANRRIP